jgi:hypothetical protein
MATDNDPLDDGRLDLVPMIDCIMLLLLFFMMTSKFVPEDLVIGSVLPTDHGGPVRTTVAPKPAIKVVVYPADLPTESTAAGYSTYLTRMRAGGARDAMVRIGGREPLRIPGAVLNGPIDSAMPAQVEQIHTYLASELGKYETAGQARNEQNDIVIHCFSGLSWKFALVTYDAVRAYEASKVPPLPPGQAADLTQARAVTFAPPRVRDADPQTLSTELNDLVHLR